jgi:hypothetical protein
VERTENISLARSWRSEEASLSGARELSRRMFATVLIACAVLSAMLASGLPLQVSVVTVFLFAGPHNWFELRYFLTRLPVRFGKSRDFFITAFAGIAFLTLTYVLLPVLYSLGIVPNDSWPIILAAWNTLLLLWVGLLVWLRGRNKVNRDWSWAFPVTLALCSLNWLAPEFFSLGIVYLHPLAALCFLDCHLARTRPEWLRTYRGCLCLLPFLLGAMFWQLSQTPALPDDNGLFWRITQHAGAQLLPGISSHVLVATHVFLEMLHYGIWLVALPLISPLSGSSKSEAQLSRPRSSESLYVESEGRRRISIWDGRSIPVARHPRGFPRLIATTLALGVCLVVILWFGFSLDYTTTRDVYFTLAIAHVLAEAPFLLKML